MNTLLKSICALGAGAALSVSAAEKPNILFIVSDDLATRVGCYGDAVAITPNIDRLATQGMVFEKAYVQGVVCTPSRTAFMLGLNNRSASRNHFQKNPDTMTMGRFLRQSGYQTFSTGKIDHTKDFLDPEAWDIWAPDESRTSKLSLIALREPGPNGRLFSRHAIAEDPARTHDALIADRAIRFLTEERDAKRPFFATIGFHKPHQPTVSTQKHFDAHSKTMAFPYLQTPPDASPIAPGYLEQEPGIAPAEKDAHLARRSYYASASGMDEELGRVLAALDRLGLDKNTLVVFTSDHGYHLGWRGQWMKHDMSEEVMRVPLIVRWPSVTPPGSRTKGIVELIDLFPTFAEAAGQSVPESLDGKSFLAQLRNPAAPGKAAAFCSDGANGRTIRTARWRLIERPCGAHELYDHASDPGEFYNLFGTAEHQETAVQLVAQLVGELGPLQQPSRPGRQKGKATTEE